MRSREMLMIVLALGCLAMPVIADADRPVVFGPDSFEVTTDGQTGYSLTFTAETGGPYVMFLYNGSDDTDRVQDASVTLNGQSVVQFGELEQDPSGARHPVQLIGGDNELTMQLVGPPGTFITLAIARPGHRPVITIGRLVLPWGQNDEQRGLALALKNGSPHHARSFRIVLLRPDGAIAGATPKLTLPPRGGLTLAIDEIPGATLWPRGSIEVYYSGRGSGRLFGTARHIDRLLGQIEHQPLDQAGLRVIRMPVRTSRR